MDCFKNPVRRCFHKSNRVRSGAVRATGSTMVASNFFSLVLSFTAGPLCVDGFRIRTLPVGIRYSVRAAPHGGAVREGLGDCAWGLVLSRPAKQSRSTIEAGSTNMLSGCSPGGSFVDECIRASASWVTTLAVKSACGPPEILSVVMTSPCAMRPSMNNRVPCDPITGSRCMARANRVELRPRKPRRGAWLSQWSILVIQLGLIARNERAPIKF